jgi:hypothetical protein
MFNNFTIGISIVVAVSLGVISNIVANFLAPHLERRKKLTWSIFIGLIVATFMLGVMASNQSKSVTQIGPVQEATPTSASVIENSPEEIMSWFKGFDNDLQANESAKKYYVGKRVQWTGEVQEIRDALGSNEVVINMKVGKSAVLAYFDDRHEIEVLPKGKVIIANCQIVTITRIGITIKNCYLVG